MADFTHMTEHGGIIRYYKIERVLCCYLVLTLCHNANKHSKMLLLLYSRGKITNYWESSHTIRSEVFTPEKMGSHWASSSQTQPAEIKPVASCQSMRKARLQAPTVGNTGGITIQSS